MNITIIAENQMERNMDNYKDTGRIKQIRSEGPLGREIIVHKGHCGHNNFHQVPCVSGVWG